MLNVFMPRSVSAPVRTMARGAPAATRPLPQRSQECRTDQQFVVMLDAYRCNGGLARAPEVVALFKRCSGSDVAVLASWIVKRKIICFEWQSIMWLPLFQFKLVDMTLRPGISQVVAELTAVHDQWQLAVWFAQPNPWLDERTPADMLGCDLGGVVRAARAARFVTRTDFSRSMDPLAVKN